MYFLIALAIALIGASIVFISATPIKKRVSHFIIMTGIYTLVCLPIVYISMPSTAYPLFGDFGLMALIFWICSACMTLSFERDWAKKCSDEQHKPKKLAKYAFAFPAIGLIMMLSVSISGCIKISQMDFNSLDARNVKMKMSEVQRGEKIRPDSLKIITIDSVMSLADRLINQARTSDILDLGHITLQKIKGNYYYLVPLDYGKNFGSLNSDFVSGYIKISATDPQAKPTLVTGMRIKYTPGAYYGANIERFLYFQYIDKLLTKYSFQEDDEGNIYWIITVCSAVSYFGKIVEGVILFNPETGQNTFVSLRDLASNPKYKWIDGLFPEKRILQYTNI